MLWALTTATAATAAAAADEATIMAMIPVIAGLVGTTLAVTLVMAQSDWASRTFLLDDALLNRKRHATYRYRWTKWWERQIYLRIEQQGSDGLDRRLIILTKVDEILSWMMQHQKQEQQTSSPVILAMGYDPRDPRAFREYMIWIATGSDTDDIIQCEIKVFAKALKEYFDHQENDDRTSSPHLCFVADASSGQGLDMMEEVAATASSSSSSNMMMMLVPRPTWMAMVMQLKHDLPQSMMQDVLEVLCRLEAQWKQREWNTTVTNHHTIENESTEPPANVTVIFTLPGQSTVSTLLPLLQSIFPLERHVFVYEGCCRMTVAHAMKKLAPTAAAASSSTTAGRRTNPSSPWIVDHELQMATPVVIPSYNNDDDDDDDQQQHQLCTTLVPTLPKVLKQLPLMTASIVESWMSSVLTMSMSCVEMTTTTSKGITPPFACAWGDLTQAFVANTSSEAADEQTITSTTSTTIIHELWQYVLTSSSSGIPLSSLARKRMNDLVLKSVHHIQEQESETRRLASSLSSSLSSETEKAIHDLILEHQSMLKIGNRTLVAGAAIERTETKKSDDDEIDVEHKKKVM